MKRWKVFSKSFAVLLEKVKMSLKSVAVVLNLKKKVPCRY